MVWHDITETRRLLIERQERVEIETRLYCLQVILDELPCGVYLVNGPDARLVLANRAATLFCGTVWSHGQPLSDYLQKNHIRTFDEHGLPLPLDQSPTYRALRKDERVYHSQITLRCEDGTMFPLLVNSINLDAHMLPLFTEQEPLALVVHQDMRILKETEQFKDEFIGMATHELRTPLAIMLGFAQTLLVQTANGHGPELADWQKEALEGIDHAGSRMAELVNDVLDIARIQAKRLTFYPLPVDIVALTNRIIRRLQVTTQKHRITLCTAVPDFVVNVDPRRIEQVLSNLLSNAIKYSPEGGKIEVTITKDKQKSCVNIAVHDYGIGIPAQQQTRIFGRFERASNARLQNIQGTGLGLYLSRVLVEQQGGSIWFESIEGQGSTFTVALPFS